ncbi:hypothetical protein DY000_02011710 [Brassica cretica]|uniref:Mitochondrial outer membrane protein porin 2-like n=1 Tax=Brassica cretica TaxID=69181 RepID=A0ABQ7DB32_BRACR|nr:hypothetical protein DY000_02011710 [Brassica cretica]
MSKGPGLFADIGKKAKDLLTRDYNTDQKFSISTYTASGVSLTSTALKKGGVHAADVTSQYKYKNAVFDFKIDTDSTILTTVTFTEILPSTKAIASFKVPDNSSGKLEVQYFHDHATVTAAAALKQNPLIDITATLGTPVISFGAEAGYDTSSKTFTKYNAGISVTKPDACASIILWPSGSIERILTHDCQRSQVRHSVGGVLEVQYFHDHATVTAAAALKQNPLIDITATLGTPVISFGAEAGYDTSSKTFTKYNAGISVTKPDACASIILGDKGDSIKASYLHHLDESKRSAAVGEVYRKFSTNENTITVGGLYAIDHTTTVKAKLNNNGKLGALLQHEVVPKSLVTVSSEIDTKALDKHPRFGLSLVLKP